VSPAMADGTTTRSCPAAFHLATRCATLRIRSIEPTDVPPYFWTMSAIAISKDRAVYRKGTSNLGAALLRRLLRLPAPPPRIRVERVRRRDSGRRLGRRRASSARAQVLQAVLPQCATELLAAIDVALRVLARAHGGLEKAALERAIARSASILARAQRDRSAFLALARLAEACAYRGAEHGDYHDNRIQRSRVAHVLLHDNPSSHAAARGGSSTQSSSRSNSCTLSTILCSDSGVRTPSCRSRSANRST